MSLHQRRSYFFVSSAHRISGSPSNFTVALDNYHRRIHSITPVHIAIPHFFGNVTTSNNKLVVNDGVSDHILTFPTGFYDTDQFFKEFSSLLTGVGLTLVAQTDMDTYNSDGFTRILDLHPYFLFTTAVTIKANSSDGSTIHPILGMDGTFVSSPSGPNHLIAGVHPVAFHGPHVCMLEMSLTKRSGWSCLNRGEAISMVDIIPLSDEDVKYGDIIHVSHENQRIHQLTFPRGSDSPDSLSVKLVDHNNQELVLPPSADVHILLQLGIT